jgi:hypothetical protein
LLLLLGTACSCSGHIKGALLRPLHGVVPLCISRCPNCLHQHAASLILRLKLPLLQGLAQELRRSAAEELLALAPDPHLLAVMAQQQHLDAIWQLCVPPE